MARRSDRPGHRLGMLKRASAGALCSVAFVAGSASPPALASARAKVPTIGVTGQAAAARGAAVHDVACPSATSCWAVGSVASGLGPLPLIDASADGGVHWAAQPPGKGVSGGLAALSCPDDRHCIAVGTSGTGSVGLVLVTSDAGRRWLDVAAPTGAVQLGAISCSTYQDCVVLATAGSGWWAATTDDGGQVWEHDGTLPPGFGGPSGVTCQGSTCMSAGYTTLTGGKGQGAIARSDDGGSTWSAAPLPPGTGPLHALSCPRPTRCLAVGTSSPNLADVSPSPSVVLTTADGGATWATGVAPPGVGDAEAISCATATRCAVVGTAWTFTNPPNAVGAVADTVDGGRNWRSSPHSPLPAGLAAVTCPVPSTCVAAGEDELARLALPPQGFKGRR